MPCETVAAHAGGEVATGDPTADIADPFAWYNGSQGSAYRIEF